MISRHSEVLRVRHAPDDIFELVSDVEKYPDFIPYLTRLRIIELDNSAAPVCFVAEAVARYKFARERFVTRVKADRSKLRVEVELVEGPFRVLENSWQMQALSDGSTRIDFDLTFQFDNMMLDMLIRANKARAVRVLIEKFVSEAARRYPFIGDADYPHLKTFKA